MISCNSKTNGKTLHTTTTLTPDCGLKDEKYSTNIHCYKNISQLSTTHILDVDIKDCEVIRIYSPNNRHLEGNQIQYDY